MPDFRFLHAADLHLDSPLRGLDRDAPTARIRGATRAALVALVDLALARNVAFVVLAGDLYDGDAKDWRTGRFLVEQLSRLVRAGIEVVAITGNHDAEQVLTRRLPVPGMLGAARPETKLLMNAPVAVHGQGFATRAVTENLSLAYPGAVADRFNIGLLHTACGQGGHENYAPCSVEDLARHGYDYWALGHVHAHRILSRDPWIVFPGNLQGRHVRETGGKGASLVTVARGRVASHEHVPLDTVRWHALEIDAGGASDRAAILDRIRERLDRTVDRDDERLHVVRLTLVGATAAHASLAQAPEAVRESVRAIALDVAPADRLWIEDLRLSTGPALDVDAMRAQPGAVGALVRALDRPVGIDPALAAFVADQARRAELALDPDHPAAAIAAGRIPDGLLERARALLLAELARD